MNQSDIFKELARFNADYIQFPSFVEAIKAIENNIVLCKKTSIANHLLIFGESGTGKSSLCMWAANHYPRRIESDRDVLPVLIVSIPPAATISGTATVLLRELGDPFPDSGNITERTARVVTLCRECRVEAVMFDEAQHLHDRGQVATQYLVGDWLKALIDKIAIPTIFLGLPRLNQLLQINEQLRRRFSKRIHLALGQGSGDVERECLQIYKTLGKALPVSLSSHPYGWDEFGMRLYYASDGRVAYVKKLLVAALRATLESGEKTLDANSLEIAFTDEVWWEGVGELNPFNETFVQRKLDRESEPFQVGTYKVGKASVRTNL